MRKITRRNSNALVLNCAGSPIDIATWEESITEYLKGNAIILAEYDDLFIHTGINKSTGIQGCFRVPSVIQKHKAPVEKKQLVKLLPLTPENLLKRDKFKCCYCHTKLTISTVTCEHVYPESLGGLTDWANCRACCSACNNKKGNKLLSELGWKLDPVEIPVIQGDVTKSIVYKVYNASGISINKAWIPFITWSIKWSNNESTRI